MADYRVHVEPVKDDDLIRTNAGEVESPTFLSVIEGDITNPTVYACWLEFV